MYITDLQGQLLFVSEYLRIIVTLLVLLYAVYELYKFPPIRLKDLKMEGGCGYFLISLIKSSLVPFIILSTPTLVKPVFKYSSVILTDECPKVFEMSL